MKNLLRALKYFRAELPRLILVFLLLLMSVGLNALKPWPLAVIVDSVIGHKSLPTWLERWHFATSATLLTFLAAVILVLHVGQGALAALQNYLSIQVGLCGLTRVRQELFGKLQRLSMRYHQRMNSGDLIYRASWDTYAFQTLFQQGLITFVTAFVSLLVMVFIMAQLNVRLTVIAILLVPLVMFTIQIFGRKMSERSGAAQQADSKVTSLVQQNIASVTLIQSFTREDKQRAAFEAQTIEAQQKRIQQHGAELVYWFGIAAVFGLGAAAITWIGSNEVLAGRLTVGELLVFVAYLAQLYEPLNQLSHVGATVSNAKAGTKRIFEILDAVEEVKNRPDAKRLIKTSAHIEFQEVSFSYTPGQQVLQKISLSLSPGESVALIGPSGSGKTTLLNLISRFFDPDQGLVKLDGIDLRDFNLQDLRRQVGVVFQQPVILPGTIAENIGFGKPEATRSEIEAAAKAANCHDFIQKFQKGYDTVVGDGAARLSIGEQQRINLARAFLKDAPILLLDEPTSALDADNERLVLDSLRELVRGRTTLIVAHRLATIRQVDKIAVLDSGKLIEIGAPDELISKPGYYSRLSVINAQ